MKKAGAGAASKNKAAVALGKLRAAKMTKEERSVAGKAGAAATNAALTKAQRKANAKKAVQARWEKAKGKKAAE
jgi:hypothetical protein